jgi:hypothetical protein
MDLDPTTQKLMTDLVGAINEVRIASLHIGQAEGADRPTHIEMERLARARSRIDDSILAIGRELGWRRRGVLRGLVASFFSR